MKPTRNKPPKTVASAIDRKGTTIIKCHFCSNTFVARPREAVCPKCKRPANRPLSWLNKILCLIIFPWGFIKAALARASEPYAAMQAVLLGAVGALGWAAIYFLQFRG